MDWIFWLYNISKWYNNAWLYSGIICMLDKYYFSTGKLGDIARRFISETRPFYFVLCGVYYVSLSLMDKFHWYTSLLFLVDVVMYYIVKQYGDDDKWKRRMQKLKEKVSVSEGKLVVVPS